ncbi:hypothetical protein [Agromyces sp. C10]|uniref:hypothetical protein n=1 Tax=Agromyces sp. C10 TaxID=2935077 RepID=UPI00200AAB3D|nr:hypothetical protein [Agromyces sp. C10]MCK8608882.1 hypothetical protein [Agromyces sp. C10]
MDLESTVPTDVSFTRAEFDRPDFEHLLRLLFAEPAPEGDHTDEPPCGLNAAFERIDRHLAWFDEDAQAVVA